MEFQGIVRFHASDSSSDSDTVDESNWKKKSTRKDDESKLEPSLKKAHEIWTEKLNEQTLLEGFGQCRLKKQPNSVYDRGCESYDYNNKFLNTKADGDDSDKSEREMDFGYDYSNYKSDDEKEEFGVLKEKKKLKKPKVKERLGEKGFENESLQKVAKKIITSLKEKKPELIHRCVQFLGRKKALELLSMTLSIEEAGGLMTRDGSRRRTPGGVYLQLLKDDPHIRKDSVDKIFQDEKKVQYELKKAARKMIRKQKMKKLEADKAKNTHATTSIVITDNPTSNATVPENSRSSDIEEGEIMD